MVYVTFRWCGYPEFDSLHTATTRLLRLVSAMDLKKNTDRWYIGNPKAEKKNTWLAPQSFDVMMLFRMSWMVSSASATILSTST